MLNHFYCILSIQRDIERTDTRSTPTAAPTPGTVGRIVQLLKMIECVYSEFVTSFDIIFKLLYYHAEQFPLHFIYTKRYRAGRHKVCPYGGADAGNGWQNCSDFK